MDSVKKFEKEVNENIRRLGELEERRLHRTTSP